MSLKTRLLLCLFFLYTHQVPVSLGKPQNIYSLDLTPGLTLEWQLDDQDDLLRAQIQFRPREDADWLAIGFSDDGSTKDADFCILWDNGRGEKFLTDTHTDGRSVVSIDRHQDCRGFELLSPPNAGQVVFRFVRPFDTCHDKEDYVIEDGTTHVVWAAGPGPLRDVDGLDVGDADNGFSRTRLLKVPGTDVPPPSDAFPLDVTHEIEIPSDDTTYWCSVHRLPRVFQRKHHIVQYEPVMTPGNEHILHHMEVFHCDGGASESFPMWQGPCGDEDAPEKLKRCKKVLAAWAIGAGPFTYPKEAGLVIGGEDANPYLMLEVHYNNEKMESGLLDRSGLRLMVTGKLRPHDAGIMELGLVYGDSTAIPPGLVAFPLSGHCVPQCTGEGFPSSGVTIFGSQLHTHATGFRVATRHFRRGVELPEVNRDDHYSTHFQEIRGLREPRRILPGDHLTTTCWYDTRSKSNAVVSGYGFDNEMCVNYVHYYPRVPVEVCKSTVDSTALKSYFAYMNRYENQDTDFKRKNDSDNYQSIHWTPARARELRSFYARAPLEMQCLKGSGEPLPGVWTQVSQPSILQPLPPTPRPSCEAETEVKKRVGFTPEAVELLSARMKQRRIKRLGFTPEAVAILRAKTRPRREKRVGFDPDAVDILRARTLARESTRRRSSRKRQEPTKRLWFLPFLKKRSEEPMNEMKKKKKKRSPDLNTDLHFGQKVKKLASVSKQPWDLKANQDKRVGQSFNEMKREPEESSGSFYQQPDDKRTSLSSFGDYLESQGQDVLEDNWMKHNSPYKKRTRGMEALLSNLQTNVARASDLFNERRSHKRASLSGDDDDPEAHQKKKKALHPLDLSKLNRQMDAAYELLRQKRLWRRQNDKRGLEKRYSTKRSLDNLDLASLDEELNRALSELHTGKRSLNNLDLSDLREQIGRALNLLNSGTAGKKWAINKKSFNENAMILSQLQRDLDEAFAILSLLEADIGGDNHGMQIRRRAETMESGETAAMAKRSSLGEERLSDLERQANEAFYILHDLGIEDGDIEKRFDVSDYGLNSKKKKFDHVWDRTSQFNSGPNMTPDFGPYGFNPKLTSGEKKSVVIKNDYMKGDFYDPLYHQFMYQPKLQSLLTPGFGPNGFHPSVSDKKRKRGTDETPTEENSFLDYAWQVLNSNLKSNRNRRTPSGDRSSFGSLMAADYRPEDLAMMQELYNPDWLLDNGYSGELLRLTKRASANDTSTKDDEDDDFYDDSDDKTYDYSSWGLDKKRKRGLGSIV